MAYWLDRLNAANAHWIVKAVEAVIDKTKTPYNGNRRETGCQERMAHEKNIA